MSKVAIEGNASGTGTLTIAAPNTSTNYTLSLPEEAGTITTSNSPYSTFRNRIINGDMRIDQRNAGASVTISTSGVYVLDRWKNRANGGGEFSVQQSSTAPAGFNNSVIYTVTTADSSIAAGDNYWIVQEIEGYNVADLDFGTANAKTITMSFWVRSSVTGTYSVFLSNATTYNRGYVATYTISVADTWEYKTVTIAGDTTGTWGKTNGGGLSVGFNLGAGTDYQTTAGSWGSAFVQATSGTTQWIATNGATFYITGVQLEVGSVATPFERRPYGTEFQLCQRYFWVLASSPGTALNSTGARFNVSHTWMRATPSVSATAALNVSDEVASDFLQSSANIAISENSALGGRYQANNFSGMTSGRFANLLTNGGKIQFSSEL